MVKNNKKPAKARDEKKKLKLPPKIDDFDVLDEKEFENLKVEMNKLPGDIDTVRNNLSPDGFKNKICAIDCDIEDLEFQIYEMKKSIRKKKRKMRVLKDEKMSLMQCYLNLNDFDWGDIV